MIKIISNIDRKPAVASIRSVSGTGSDSEPLRPELSIRISDRVTLSDRGRTLSHRYASVEQPRSDSQIFAYEIRRPFTSPKMTEHFKSHTKKVQIVSANNSQK